LEYREELKTGRKGKISGTF